ILLRKIGGLVAKTLKKSDRYHHGSLRQACIKQGLRFLSKGQPGFSFRELARELKVSPGAPYKHFENKEELLAAISEEGFHQFSAALRESKAMSENKTPEEKFMNMGRAYLNFALDNPDHYRLMFSNAVPEHEVYATLHETAQSSFSELTSMVEGLQKIGYFANDDVMEQSMLIWTQVHGFVSLVIEGRLGFVEERAAISIDEMNHRLGKLMLKSLT
ncbi:MAG: TetR/AcrR family transcriptional regulator, partial [Pseudomonadota bacterium]